MGGREAHSVWVWVELYKPLEQCAGCLRVYIVECKALAEETK